MANNIFGGQANATVARVTESFANIGFTASNISIVYEIGADIKSWVPGRGVNGITGTTEGKGYYIVAKQSMDKTTFFVPPVPAGGGGEGIQVFNSIPSGSFGTDFFAGDLVIL